MDKSHKWVYIRNILQGGQKMEFEGLTQTIFRVVILFTRQNQLTLTLTYPHK